MAVRPLAPVLHYLRRVRGEAPDAGLLEQFVKRGDEAAFATLLQRYGPMVFGVCRRVLRDRHDAEDAFQATFLLLVRKARSLGQPELLGHWLYGVAYRTALKAKSAAFRRRTGAANLDEVPAAPTDDVIWRDLRPVLDDAIDRLPAKYRVPFVLCYLQGLTQAQAARQMGCPEGTVATRLSRARQQLRTRLARHGLGVAAGTAALGVWSRAASATLPALLLVSTLRMASVFRTGPTSASADIPAKVAALTEGVSQAMFMTKLRFVLGTVLIGFAAVGGTGVWTYGAFASQPVPQAPPAAERIQPPAVVVPQPVIRGQVPAAVPPAAEKEEANAIASSENFEVHAPTKRIAQLVADAAERFRKSEATRWLGKELPAWSERCPLRVRVTNNGTGGATTFEFDGGKINARSMHLEGPLDRILAGCLPHEITHTILAEHFRAQIPRWADEGAAILAEDDDEQQRHLGLIQTLIKDNRLIPMTRLVRLSSYPPDVMALYAEGFSLTHFLVEKKDRKTFLAFVAQGMNDDGWNKAAKKHYGYDDMEALEDAWLARAKKEAKERPQAEATKRPEIKGAAPTVGRARIEADGFLTLRFPLNSYEPRTAYVKRDGSDEQTPVTRYESKIGEQVIGLDVKRYEATDLKGTLLDKADLAKWLAEEMPVLIALDGKKVDPYYLKVIKEGTIILLPQVRQEVEIAPPALRLTEPPSAPKPVGH